MHRAIDDEPFYLSGSHSGVTMHMNINVVTKKYITKILVATAGGIRQPFFKNFFAAVLHHNCCRQSDHRKLRHQDFSRKLSVMILDC